MNAALWMRRTFLKTLKRRGSIRPGRRMGEVLMTVESFFAPGMKTLGLGAIVCSLMGSGLLSGAMTAERIAALPADEAGEK